MARGVAARSAWACAPASTSSPPGRPRAHSPPATERRSCLDPASAAANTPSAAALALSRTGPKLAPEPEAPAARFPRTRRTAARRILRPHAVAETAFLEFEILDSSSLPVAARLLRVALMSNVTVCVRFRPLSHKERKANGDNICFKKLDSESFVVKRHHHLYPRDLVGVAFLSPHVELLLLFLSFGKNLSKDERDEDVIFSFDKVFYEDAEQSDVYNFLAVPIVSDAIDGTNGTIITYGQTGAGKTYSMEVEIYLEKVRDLLHLSKDNLQIKESKTQGIYISGATEISVMNGSDALENLSQGIANRAVGETQMNLASSRSHCLYIFAVQHGSTSDERVKAGKIILVDLAGSEKVEKTGAEGRVLDEAKTINKSLSALGNVINALTTGKQSHVPFRDSKLTRILQDALGGNSRAALLCCCSPSPSNAPESLTKLIKTPPKSIPEVVDNVKKPILETQDQDGLRDRILSKLRLSLKEEDVDLLEELFMLEGIIFDPSSVADIDSACQDAASEEISLLMQAVEELKETVEEVASNIYTSIHTSRMRTRSYGETWRWAQDIAAQAQHAAAAGRASSFLDFIPAALLRPFGSYQTDGKS
ncbi:hypothetical protein PR202_ga30872 [Eleusine coracana subsp. coracana]|uniref:Kinesin-like protein n=1 Tax=Eleusine coracana subsp. coracana TaxID=191504 RepID=A0AAV5DQW4_ELECO|nr:hypothetical protein PR202_ga30872 [Eleusine coracana subsp. coracana]